MDLPLYDQRKAERILAALPLTYVIECGAQPLEGRTTNIDIGGGGVRFLIPCMVSPQTMGRLTLSLPNQADPLLFAARVSWCRQVKTQGCDQFEVGMGFVITPSDDITAFECYCQFIAGQILLKHVS